MFYLLFYEKRNCFFRPSTEKRRVVFYIMDGVKEKPLILDGKKVSRLIREELKDRVVTLRRNGIVPKLAIVLVGEYEPSLIYVTNKERACRSTGIEVETFRLGADVEESTVVEIINRCNEDRKIHGIILQLPLPGHLDKDRLLEVIKPEKDVDGLTPVNLGKLAAGKPRFIPATPSGIVELLIRYSISPKGRRVVIVGRGELVGKPLANLLLMKGERGDATVTVCHSQTLDLKSVCRAAEILVVAAGKPGLIKADMVSEGAVVVDAGIHRTEQGIIGDVDFDSVAKVAGAITPVPGGVGPMTVAMLLYNTVEAADGSGDGN